jgi:hypothetical protein
MLHVTFAGPESRLSAKDVISILVALIALAGVFVTIIYGGH